MKLFVASGIFHPESGGPATYLYHVLPEFQKRGHSIDVIAFGDSPSTDYPYPLKRIPRRNYVRRQWDYFRGAAQLWANHDVAFVHSVMLPLPRAIQPRVMKIVGDPAWERSMNRGWVPPTTDIDTFQTQSYGFNVALNKFQRNREIRKAAHIIVPSEYLRQMVIGWGAQPANVTTIYNAMHARPDALINQAEARQQLNLDARSPLLLCVARLTSWKGIDVLLNVLQWLPDVRLLIAGDGPMRDQLIAQRDRLNLVNRVEFLGRVGRDRMPLYYQAADYTVLYSGYEGLSHVLLESLNYGTPVIASDKGGNPEVVAHGVNGFLVQYKDADALQAALEVAFADNQRHQLAQNTQFGLERFQWDVMIDQTLQILGSVI